MIFKKLISILLVITLTGCQLESSPWETDIECDNLNIEKNLKLLKEKELKEGVKNHTRVAITGDIQLWIGAFDKIIEDIDKKGDVDMVFILGDLTELGLKEEFKWVCDSVGQLDIPVFSVIGNHDSISFGKEIWLKNIGDYDYTFNYQNNQFVAYNDNQYEFENTPAQEFLNYAASLGINSNHIIGLSHYPPGKESDYDQRFKDLGFTYMLHAHSHKTSHWNLFNLYLTHYVVNDAKDIEYAIANIYEDNIVMETCNTYCTISVPITH